MKTFEMRNGDLVVGQRGYSLISGPTKVRQDLGIACREPYGSDPYHPGWGSMLADMVGRIVDPETEALIRGEMVRLVRNYSTMQNDSISTDVALRRLSRFGAGEVVQDIERIAVAQQYDRFTVKVVIRTLSGEEISLLNTVVA